jgi:hypothetical protein
MIIRSILLRLCTTRTELRLLLKAVRAYGAREATEKERAITKDRRIKNSMRLSVAVAALVVFRERPQLFAIGVLSIPVAAVLLIGQILIFAYQNW